MGILSPKEGGLGGGLRCRPLAVHPYSMYRLPPVPQMGLLGLGARGGSAWLLLSYMGCQLKRVR